MKQDEIQNNLIYKKASQSFLKENQGTILTHVLKNTRIIRRSQHLSSLKNSLKNKSIYIIGAGPSLDKEIKSLKAVTKDPNTVIIALDLALKVLLNQNIRVDYCFTCETRNIRFFKGLNTKNIILISFIGSNSHNVTDWKGEILFYNLQMNHPFFNKLDQLIKTPIHKLNTGGIILTHALSMAYQFNAKNITLLGNDLSYKKNQFYCKGTVYTRKDEKIILKSSVSVRVQRDNKIHYTTPQMDIAYKWIQDFIQRQNITNIQWGLYKNTFFQRILKRLPIKLTYFTLTILLFLSITKAFTKEPNKQKNIKVPPINYSKEQYWAVHYSTIYGYDPERFLLYENITKHPATLELKRKAKLGLLKFEDGDTLPPDQLDGYHLIHQLTQLGIPYWLKELRSGNTLRRRTAIKILGYFYYDSLVPHLIKEYDKTFEETFLLMDIFYRCQSPKSIPFLKKQLKSEYRIFRQFSATTLLLMGEESALQTYFEDMLSMEKIFYKYYYNSFVIRSDEYYKSKINKKSFKERYLYYFYNKHVKEIVRMYKSNKKVFNYLHQLYIQKRFDYLTLDLLAFYYPDQFFTDKMINTLIQKHKNGNRDLEDALNHLGKMKSKKLYNKLYRLKLKYLKQETPEIPTPEKHIIHTKRYLFQLLRQGFKVGYFFGKPEYISFSSYNSSLKQYNLHSKIIDENVLSSLSEYQIDYVIRRLKVLIKSKIYGTRSNAAILLFQLPYVEDFRKDILNLIKTETYTKEMRYYNYLPWIILKSRDKFYIPYIKRLIQKDIQLQIKRDFISVLKELHKIK